jgi:hypothetical protein
VTRLASFIADRFVLAWLAGAAVWLAYLVSLALGGWRHDASKLRLGADHVQYYAVGQFLDEGEPALIYDEPAMTRRQEEIAGEGFKGVLPFRYPPFYALAFAPTSRLSYEASFLVWTAISFGCLLLAGRLLGVGWRPWLLWSLCFYPVFAAFSYGQNALVSLAVLSGAAALWLRGRPFLAGLVLGLLSFKPPLALGVGMLWVFDFRRSWTALLGIVLTTGALALVGWLTIPSAYEAFLASLRGNVARTEPDPSTYAPLYSSQGFWMLLSARLGRLQWVTSAAGLVAFFLLWRRLKCATAVSAVSASDRTADTAVARAAYGLAVLVTPWLSPYAMVYDWSILLVAAVLLKGELPRERWLVLCALIWLAALVSLVLVWGQLWLSGRHFAIQLAFPALVFAALSLWNPGRRAVEQPPSGTT